MGKEFRERRVSLISFYRSAADGELALGGEEPIQKLSSASEVM
jgi:hypothetical protein